MGMNTTNHGKDSNGNWVPMGATTDSAGNPAGNMVLSDKSTSKTTRAYQVSAIGDITGEAISLDLTGQGATRYRVYPSGVMRVCEDAINVTQAEAWLQAAGAWAALAAGQRECFTLAATTWSDWRYFSEGSEITNLWFLRDEAGTATATALVEYE